MNKSRRRTVFFCTAGLLLSVQANLAQAEEGFAYEDVSDLQFGFSSGVGAWGTILNVHEDGSFEGSYHDSDMGDIGDGYPNGTVYLSNFSGQFGEPEKQNEYTYSVDIQEIELEQNAGTSEIIDGVRYIYSEPYGLNDAEYVLFYLQGAPLAELPEAYRSWVGYYDLSAAEETVLPFTGLYNETAESGFASYVYKEEEVQAFPDTQQSVIDSELEALEAKAAEIETQLDSGMLSQSELNQLSGELYVLWDDELNSMWQRIREKLPKEEMDRLTAEELAWIEEKETSVAEAGAEFEGGSMQPFIENSTAANLTKSRVYELADYLRE